MEEVKIFPVISQEIRLKLRESFPPEAIQQHPTKKFLSTIKAIYVTERLNDVFGLGRWSVVSEVVKETENYILMRGTIEILDYNAVIPYQYGGHTTTGTNTELADGYKSAVTDIMSKCASYLEIGIDVFKGKQTHTQLTQNVNKETGENEEIPFCSICGKEMKKSQKGKFYCKHDDKWGQPIFKNKTQKLDQQSQDFLDSLPEEEITLENLPF